MERRNLRDLVFDVLRKMPQTHFRAVENEIRRLAEDYERRDVLLLNEVLWEMLVQGILAPGKNSLNPDLPFVHVTEYGSRCLDGGALVAHDPDRFIDRIFEGSGGKAAEPLLSSLRSALGTFLDGRHGAAIVLLGHAAEHVLGELADALVRHGRRSGRGTKRLQASLDHVARVGPAVHRSLSDLHLPEPLEAELDVQITGLIALVELSRSKKGRPRVPSADRDMARARFLLLLDQCRFAYDAIEWLESGIAK